MNRTHYVVGDRGTTRSRGECRIATPKRGKWWSVNSLSFNASLVLRLGHGKLSYRICDIDLAMVGTCAARPARGASRRARGSGDVPTHGTWGCAPHVSDINLLLKSPLRGNLRGMEGCRGQLIIIGFDWSENSEILS